MHKVAGRANIRPKHAHTNWNTTVTFKHVVTLCNGRVRFNFGEGMNEKEGRRGGEKGRRGEWENE